VVLVELDRDTANDVFVARVDDFEVITEGGQALDGFADVFDADIFGLSTTSLPQ